MLLNEDINNNPLEERITLSVEDAETLLPDGDTVHTFLNTSMMLLGADWSRDAVIQEMKKFGVELSGRAATAMHHGLVIIRPKSDGGNVFVETKETFMGRWPENG